MILDTNAVSAALQGNTQAGKVILGSRYLAVPVIVVAEYLFGLRSSNRRSELTSSLHELIRETDLLVVDRGSAETYADIRFALKQLGKPIPTNDLWIAALALQHNLPILSRDAHFDAVEGLERIDW